MSQPSGRVLALDLGEVRIGVALSDPLGVTAQPVGNIQRVGKRRDLAAVRELVEQHEVARIVIGNPLLLSGEAGTGTEGAEAFAEELRKRLPEVPVELWDERLTTVEAERTLIGGGVRRGKRRKVIDAMAATLILQSYLDSRAVDPDASLPPL